MAIGIGIGIGIRHITGYMT
jgi:hypothetical protein